MAINKRPSSRVHKICIYTGLAALLSFGSISAQAEVKLENGVAPHEKIDTLYDKLSDAVSALNTRTFSDIYASDAFYLVPSSPLIQGLDDINPSWDGWFSWMKEVNGTLQMDFRVVAREVHDDTIGYDVGYATTLQKRPNAPDELIEVKILVVTKKQADGEWRFQVDTYSELKKK
jgi:ketosteroid isomerase-like protein